MVRFIVNGKRIFFITSIVSQEPVFSTDVTEKNFSVTYGISGIWKSVEKRRHEMV